MIKFVKGNIFDFEADIRINTVNCVGVMGAGVALLFKNRYPEMFIEYAQACLKNEVRPGFPHVWKQSTMFADLTIINFPTKDHWKNPSEYVYVEKGLSWLRNYLNGCTNKTVTIPALGCGHGGLDWSIVKEMIASSLKDINCEILVFEPAASTVKDLPNEITQELKANNITRLTPSDDLYPAKIKGRSGIEIFYKGNLGLLSEKKISIIISSKPEQREINAISAFIDSFPKTNNIFLLGFNSSHEIDVAKQILQNGFRAILAVPYGIARLKVRKDINQLISHENVAFLSITNPTQTWKSYESIASLKFRLKIADITIINSLHFKNFARFENEFKESKHRKFYLSYWNEPIDFFARIEAIKIGVNPETKKPNSRAIMEALDKED